MFDAVLGYRVKSEHDGEIIVVTLQLHEETWEIRGVPDQIEELLSSAASHIRDRFLKDQEPQDG